jgi:hypothetical protein
MAFDASAASSKDRATEQTYQSVWRMRNLSMQEVLRQCSPPG